MKAIKSLSKIIISLILALSLVTLTACDVLDDFFGKGGENGGTGDGNVYQVTLENNGGTFTDSFTEYTSGTAKNLPANGTKDHYTFDGWYANSDFSGNLVSKIPTGATGDKTYYAKWTPETYNLTFSIKDDSLYSSPVTSYTYGTACTLPTPEKDNNNFNGWYANSDLSGSKVTEIAVGEYGSKTFYGEWVSQQVQPQPTKYSVTLHANGGELKSNLTEYTEGVGATLPTPSKSGFTFGGWYANSSCTGSEVTSIPANATGAKEFWAKWIAQTSDTLTVTAFGGYEEGAYIEFNMVSGVSSYSVAYKAKNSSDAFKTIDSELVRADSSSGTVRADVVGISAGDYTLQVTAGSNTATKDVTVTSYDRSGYAHFKNPDGVSNYSDGVGAYKDDGMPKSNAYIVYVDESTKNSVKAPWWKSSSSNKGIVKLLQDVKNAGKPVIIRVLGKVSAATWEEIKYSMPASGALAPEDVISQTEKLKKITLSTKSYSQADLVKLGFKYNTAQYSILDNLEGKLKYDSKKLEFDSCWNDCGISDAKNVTLEGIGTDAEIFQWGFTWSKANSVEVRNLTFSDYTEDACSFQGTDPESAVADKYGSYNIWLHNCTFNRGMNYWDVCSEQDKHDGDGATDFKNVGNVTVSYVRYYNNHKTGLVGSGDTSYSSNVTFHHNFYDQCESRLPMGRQANIHMYNNYYRKVSSYCLSARNNMYAFVEGCYFENCSDTIRTETNAVVKLFGCEFSGCNYKTSYAITQATSRGQVVDNKNFMNPSKQTSGYSLDNDSNMFYLNGDGTTKATLLTDATKAKWDCVNMAGTLKISSWVKVENDTKLNQVYPIKTK